MLSFTVFDPVAGGSTFLRNVDKYLQNYTASHTKRPRCEYVLINVLKYIVAMYAQITHWLTRAVTVEVCVMANCKFMRVWEKELPEAETTGTSIKTRAWPVGWSGQTERGL
jgi:hypothetical protein